MKPGLKHKDSFMMLVLQYSCLENPWIEEPGRLQSRGSLRVGHDWATSLSVFTFMHWRRKWQPTPVFLPGGSQGQRSLVGCHLWGHTESDTTGATWQQQQHDVGLKGCHWLNQQEGSGKKLRVTGLAKALEGGEEGKESLLRTIRSHEVAANLRKAEPGEVQGTKGVVWDNKVSRLRGT